METYNIVILTLVVIFAALARFFKAVKYRRAVKPLKIHNKEFTLEDTIETLDRRMSDSYDRDTNAQILYWLYELKDHYDKSQHFTDMVL